MWTGAGEVSDGGAQERDELSLRPSEASLRQLPAPGSRRHSPLHRGPQEDTVVPRTAARMWVDLTVTSCCDVLYIILVTTHYVTNSVALLIIHVNFHHSRLVLEKFHGKVHVNMTCTESRLPSFPSCRKIFLILLSQSLFLLISLSLSPSRCPPSLSGDIKCCSTVKRDLRFVFCMK